MKRFILGVSVLLVAAAWLHAQRPASRWANLNGNKIHYYDIGSPKSRNALVFIHGWTCNADFWRTSYNAFPHQRVIAVDLPGHGKSDKPNISYSIQHFAKALDAVLKQAGISKAVLAGHSMGTPVARQYFRENPDRTLAIIVVDGPMRPLGPKEQMEKFMAPMRADYKPAAAKFIDSMIASIKDDSLRQFIRNGMLSTPEHVALSAMQGLAAEGIWGTDKIDKPVLAVMAPLEANWPPGLKEAYASVAPKIEFHEWSDVGHFLMMERPDEFNALVRDFIIRNKLL